MHVTSSQMIKKIFTIFIFASFLAGVSPLLVSAERFIPTPTKFTVGTAPHSAKPKAKAKSKKATVRNLKLGMKGADVSTLQKFLIKKSVGPAAKELASHKATNNFGPLTDKALREFQASKGLPVDGIAGAQIRAQYNK